MLLVALALPLLGILALLVQSQAQMFRHVLGPNRLEDVGDARLADVHEHVRVREPLHRALHRRLRARLRVRRRDRVPVRRERALAAKVVLEHFAVRDGDDAVVVEAQPATIRRRLDQDKVVTAVHVARVDQDAVQSVLVRLGPVRLLVEVRLEVDLERELMPVVDLDVLVAVHVVLEALELEVQDGRELFEDDTLLGVLQSIAFGVVPVLAVKRLDLDIISERLLEVPQVLDVQLDVCTSGTFRSVHVPDERESRPGASP